MNSAHEYYQPYSWHQSHDQVTVILLVPYETSEEDVSVQFERNHLVAGAIGQPPIVKGRLYGPIDVANCLWQLEARAGRLSARERTTSTTSTASTQSSFAFVSDPDFSSSFAASVEGGFVSDFDESLSSPALSSPISLSGEEFNGNGYLAQTHARRRRHFTTSGPVSPHTGHQPSSMASSLSSMESLHVGTSRLLTIHLEKAEPTIWPYIIVGPVPEALSPSDASMFPWATDTFSLTDSKYNMDPTSLALLGLQYSDIREDDEEAFEYFIRAWHLAHVPSATMRLATNYIPPHIVPPELLDPTTPQQSPSAAPDGTPTHSPDSTPIPSSAPAAYTNSGDTPLRGTVSYYLNRIGSAEALGQLYLEAGMLYLEGSAPSLLTLSSPGLSSLRTPTLAHPQPFSRSSLLDPHASGSSHTDQPGNEQWNYDQAHARRFFARARELHPTVDVPLLPASHSGSEPDSHDSPIASGESAEHRLRMPTVKVHSADADQDEAREKQVRRRRRKNEDTSSVSAVGEEYGGDDDNMWYLYLPGLVGAGTALLVVGFLSFSSWRKGQGS